MSKKVYVPYFKSRESVTRALHQYDYGQVLVFDSEEFPSVSEVHFANIDDEKATIVYGNNNCTRIPDKYLKTGKDINAWIYYHSKASDGESVYHVLIPVVQRSAIEASGEVTPIEYIFNGGTASSDISECLLDGSNASNT